MKTPIYWTQNKFPGRIAIVPRPRGGDWLEDEILSFKQSGIDVIVSLIEKQEEIDLGLEPEKEVAEANGLLFFSFPIVDRNVPTSKEKTLEFLLKLERLLKIGKNIGIHCRQSVGRSALIAAGLFSLFGISPENAFQQLSIARGLPMPETEEQKEWIEEFAAELVLSV